MDFLKSTETDIAYYVLTQKGESMYYKDLVLDVIEKIIESGRSGQSCLTETDCERPAAFADWQSLLK